MTASTILTKRSPKQWRDKASCWLVWDSGRSGFPWWLEYFDAILKSSRHRNIIKTRCIIIEAENYPECWRSLCKPSWGSPRGNWRSWRQSPWGRHSCSCTGSSCCPSRWCSWSRTSPSVTRTPPPRTGTHSSCNNVKMMNKNKNVEWRIKWKIGSVFVVQPDKFNYD